MSKSYKLKDGYLDSKGIVHNKEKLSDILTTKTSTVTIESAYISDVDVNVVTKCGKVCRVDFRGKVIADIPNNTMFLKLPYEPVQQITIMGGIGERYTISSPKWMYLLNNGEIRDGAISKGNYLHLMFTYICK